MSNESKTNPITRLFITGAMFATLYFVYQWWKGPSIAHLPEEVILSNEELILADVYWAFAESEEYERGKKMKPPFIFDEVYAVCLNMHSGCVDSTALNDKNTKIDVEWDDWSLDKDVLREMIDAKTPIVELHIHWVDPASPSGNNGIIKYTYFYPYAKVVDGKFEKGTRFKCKSKIPGLKYFPYFKINKSDSPLGERVYMDFENPSVLSQKIMYNGSISTIAQLIKP
jgi:hypothetical protein